MPGKDDAMLAIQFIEGGISVCVHQEKRASVIIVSGYMLKGAMHLCSFVMKPFKIVLVNGICKSIIT